MYEKKKYCLVFFFSIIVGNVVERCVTSAATTNRLIQSWALKIQSVFALSVMQISQMRSKSDKLLSACSVNVYCMDLSNPFNGKTTDEPVLLHIGRFSKPRFFFSLINVIFTFIKWSPFVNGCGHP